MFPFQKICTISKLWNRSLLFFSDTLFNMLLVTYFWYQDWDTSGCTGFDKENSNYGVDFCRLREWLDLLNKYMLKVYDKSTEGRSKMFWQKWLIENCLLDRNVDYIQSSFKTLRMVNNSKRLTSRLLALETSKIDFGWLYLFNLINMIRFNYWFR